MRTVGYNPESAVYGKDKQAWKRFATGVKPRATWARKVVRGLLKRKGGGLRSLPVLRYEEDGFLHYRNRGFSFRLHPHALGLYPIEAREAGIVLLDVESWR